MEWLKYIPIYRQNVVFYEVSKCKTMQNCHFWEAIRDKRGYLQVLSSELQLTVSYLIPVTGYDNLLRFTALCQFTLNIVINKETSCDK